MFPKEYVNFGKITHTNCTVSVYSDNFHSRNLNSVPTNIERAYWQGDTIHLEMKDGWHWIYEDFNGHSHHWKQ